MATEWKKAACPFSLGEPDPQWSQASATHVCAGELDAAGVAGSWEPRELPAHAASSSGESGGVNEPVVTVCAVVDARAGDDESMTNATAQPYQLMPPRSFALKKKSFALACVAAAWLICHSLFRSVNAARRVVISPDP